jgi:hypothetical protein
MNVLSVFDSPKPQFSDAEIATNLARDFGLKGSLKPLVSERDQNAQVRTGTADYVLKISNAAENREFLELQNAVLRHVASVDENLGIPHLVAAQAGEDIVDWRSPSGTHAVRLLTYLNGSLFSTEPRGLDTLASLGRFMGRLSAALKGFGHRAAHRQGFLWNLDEASATKVWIDDIVEPANRGLVERIFARYDERVLPSLPELRAAVIHQDANDNNILVNEIGEVSGLIDFGDLTFGRQINELAVTLAYALLDRQDIYKAAHPLIAGYAKAFPLEPLETELLFDLVAARLAMSVAISSHRAKDFPDNSYLLVSQAPAFRLLARLDQTNPDLLAAFAREAAGLPPVANHDRIVSWLSSSACRPKPLFDFELRDAGRFVVEMKTDAPGMEHRGNPDAYWNWLRQKLAAENARYAIGLYGEDRDVYQGDQFRTAASPEWRSQHLGVDFFIEAGTPLYAPLDGKVLSVVDNAAPYDYGPTVILEHEADGVPFWTLYGHLSRQCLELLSPGVSVKAGQALGAIGGSSVNGGWAPHLHFQIMTDRLGMTGDFPGAGQPGLWPVWNKISPDPNVLLKLAPESFRTDMPDPALLLQRRADLLGPSLSISYRHKLEIVRGEGAYLFDHRGRAYVDGVNNICHVGHSHPHVVEAIARQAAILNTNTRYLHETILDYAERLGRKFPKPLSVVYMVCSGSEANELALRMARNVTGRRNVITLDWGYHGNTSGLIDVSPYKFNRKGGQGKPDHVEIATLPDPYRGPYKGYSKETASAYVTSIDQCVEIIGKKTGQGPAAFIAEAISGCGGQVMFPKTYLAQAAARVRNAGGLVIVDEVQTGFGRVGTTFWAHELQDVVPDIVTLGKPIGNGHPMAAVITTPEIARAFANGMEFFSSFGGNPVSAAAGMAVLDVIEQEDLQAKALVTGNYLRKRLETLAQRFEIIGDVRGEGLFLGVEMVKDRVTLDPATVEAGDVINRLREMGILLSTDGPFDNVLKIKPPLAFGLSEADRMADALEAVLPLVS